MHVSGLRFVSQKQIKVYFIAKEDGLQEIDICVNICVRIKQNDVYCLNFRSVYVEKGNNLART